MVEIRSTYSGTEDETMRIRGLGSAAALIVLMALSIVGFATFPNVIPAQAQPAASDTTSTTEPTDCQTASADQLAGHDQKAIIAYFHALLIPGSTRATTGLTSLLSGSYSVAGTAKQQQSCDEAKSLRQSGELDSAEKRYASLLMSTPDLGCAKAGLLALVGQRVAIDCLEGQKLLDAHQFSLAIAKFQAAIEAAGTAKEGQCGSQGLLQVQADETWPHASGTTG